VNQRRRASFGDVLVGPSVSKDTTKPTKDTTKPTKDTTIVSKDRPKPVRDEWGLGKDRAIATKDIRSAVLSSLRGSGLSLELAARRRSALNSQRTPR
jgi:hypothetical protein